MTLELGRQRLRIPEYLDEDPNNLQNYGEISSYPPAIYYHSVGWYVEAPIARAYNHWPAPTTRFPE